MREISISHRGHRRTASGWSRNALWIVLMTGLAIGVAEAQVLYGSLVGNVVDQNGAVVPNATVSIKNQGTGQVRETTTNAAGEYTIPNILPGVYDVKVTKQDFSTFSQTDLTVTANNVARVEVVMKIGNVADVISVAANATALQTESGTVKSELSGREINAMPLAAYRNYQSLLNLVPGATPSRFQNANTDAPERALTTNVNGTARNNNNTRIDGATSVNIWLPHNAAYVPPSESIQEVNIATNNFDAEQGMSGGAAIQVITKSGTNQIHGSAFAYHDNHLFQAKNLFHQNQLGPNKPKNLRTIPGGTIGGPIVKDKLFYFGSFEGLLERLIRQNTFNVPTADQRAGNFSRYANTAIYNPFTGNPDGTGRTKFDNNIIPAGLINPVAAKLLALIPLPNIPGEQSANYLNSAPQTMDRYNYDVKVNWNRSERHQIWAKWSHMDAAVTGQFRLGAAGGLCLCDGGSGTGDTSSHVGTIGHTLTLGNNFIIDGNFAITNRTQQVTGPDYGTNFGSDVLGIPGTNGPDIRQSGFPQFIMDGYETLGNANNWSPLFRDERSYTGTTNLNKLYKNHDLRFGIDIIRHQLNHWQPEIGVGPRGAFTFSGAETALNGGTVPINQYNRFAAFLLGTPINVQKSLQYEVMTTREWQTGLYFRDRWQVSRNLTLTLGLRYELYPIMKRADRGIERLDLNSPVQLDPVTGLPNGNMRMLIGDRGDNSSSLDVESSKKLFAPRLGFAYRLGNETVIRGGYGMTYDPMPFGRPLRGFYPLTIAQTFVADYNGRNLTYSPYGRLDGTGQLDSTFGLNIPPFSGPDLSSGVVNLPGTVQQRSPYAGTLHRGYIQSWNLFIERKLFNDIKVEVGYVGTQTTHQLADLELNAAEPNGAQPLAVKYGRTASTLMWDGFLSANYHALQVAFTRRLSNGLFIKGAYTYSAAINMTDDTGWAGLTFNSPSALSRNRARAGYDIPHNFQTGFGYELPFGKGKKWASRGVAGAIAGGWQVNSIFSYFTGRPFTVTASGGSLAAPNGGSQTPDQIQSEVKKLGGIGPGDPYYDPSAFAVVTGPGRFGTTGRNTLRQPDFANLDFSLVRVFRLKERLTMDFRVDAFNFTNTPHFVDDGVGGNRVQANVSNANPFTITSANADQRQFRFGIRFGW
ncbi:MAG TPA: TonB-dependent receptor [Blastocatellia bacterium]|nr:TonB-dependent receptor [Blastocatellia bacterium]